MSRVNFITGNPAQQGLESTTNFLQRTRGTDLRLNEYERELKARRAIDQVVRQTINDFYRQGENIAADPVQPVPQPPLQTLPPINPAPQTAIQSRPLAPPHAESSAHYQPDPDIARIDAMSGVEVNPGGGFRDVHTKQIVLDPPDRPAPIPNLAAEELERRDAEEHWRRFWDMQKQGLAGAASAPAMQQVAVSETAPAIPQPPSPSASSRKSLNDILIERLAEVDGGGTTAMNLAQQEQRQKNLFEDRAMQMLATGKIEEGLYYANKAGVQIPNSLVHNAAFWTASSIAKQFYGSDQKGTHRFLSAFMTDPSGTIHERIARATEAAGPPSAKSGKFGSFFVDPSDGVVYHVNQYGATPIETPDGTPFRGVKPSSPRVGGGGSGGGGGGTTDYIARQIMSDYQRRGQQINYTDAINIARRGVRDQDTLLRREGLAQSAARNDPAFLTDPTGTLNRYREFYSANQAPMQLNAPPAPRQVAPAVPAAPAPTASPFQQFPDARRAPDGHWYIQRGGRYVRVEQ